MLKRRIYGRLSVVRPLVSNKKNKTALSFFLLITVVSFSIGLNVLLFRTTKAAAITWDGDGPGSDWCTDANWSNDAEPTSSDSVTIAPLALLNITTSGCVTESHNINFDTLIIGDGIIAVTLTLTTNISAGGSITVKNASSLVQDNTTIQTITGALTVDSGGILTHSENSATHSYEVDFQAATIVISGSVDVDARGSGGGLSGANGSGTGPGIYEAAGGDGSGGAHSGAGGATLGGTAGGAAYCDNNNPNTLGSGGGGSNGMDGGDGGGLARLKATTSITVSGAITANGGTTNVIGPIPATSSGGGGAGAVKLDAPTVNISNATINAIGGNSSAGNKGGGGGGGCVFINYTTAYTWTGAATSTAGGTGANSGGAGSYISNALPTLGSFTFGQSSANIATTTVTITDLDSNITNLIVEHSADNITWTSSTLANITESGEGGGVTTSTGNIAGIDTNLDGSIALTIEWNVGTDLPNTDDSAVFMRLTPNDGYFNGSTYTATLAVDTASPTAPGQLGVSSTSTTGVVLRFGSATVDTNFKEYKIFYSQSTPVTTADSSLTSSTDANLGYINYNGASTASISSLSVNTKYYSNIWAYDLYERSASSSAEINFYTLASAPSGAAAAADSSSQITVSWTGDGTEYYAENITAGTNSGWIAGTSHAFSGLTAGTEYSFRVKANNGDGIATDWGSTVSATTQSEGGGGVPIPPAGGGGADPAPPKCEGQDCQPKKPTGQVGGYLLINDDAAKTTSANVNLNLYFTKFVSTFAVTEANAQLACDFSGKSFGDIGASNVFNENYNTKIAPFALSVGFGSKKVCVKYRGSLDGGKSFVDYDAFDSILFEEVGAPKVPAPEPLKPIAPQEPLPENPPANPPVAPPSNPAPEGGGEPGPAAPSGGGEPEPSRPSGGVPASSNQGGSSGGSEPEQPSQPSGSQGVSETAADISNAVKETSGIINVMVIEPMVEVVKVTAKSIKKVIDNPKVEKANEMAVAPAIILAGAANVAVGFNAAQLLLALRCIFSQPLLLLRLRKRKSWGVIYNSLNKMPVDLAVVRLIDESTGRIVQSQVTDAQGRYLITVEPGEYHLEVDKQGFSGFSKLLRDKDEDAKFIHLYHGGKFQITETETESVLNYNIPLDPVDEIKGNNLIVREHTKKAAQNIICIIGLVASILSFIVSPKLIIFAFVLLHLMFYWMFYRFSHRKVTAGSFGSVTEMIMEEPISKAVVRVFDSMYNKLVDTAVTDRKGRYAVLVGPSKYYTTYEKDGFEKKQSEVLDFSSEKTNGMGGLINRDEKLKRSSYV